MKEKVVIVLLTAFLGLTFLAPPLSAENGSDPILDAMSAELQRSIENLSQAGDAPLYYLNYEVIEERVLYLGAQDGGMTDLQDNTNRYLDVDVRVGSMELDNTHELRGGSWRENYTPYRQVDFPLNDQDTEAMRAILWNETEFQFRKAQERLTKVLTNRQVKVEEEDLSSDFSAGQVNVYNEAVTSTVIDVDYWQDIIKDVATYFTTSPVAVTSGAHFRVTDKTTWLVNSEGTKLKHGNQYLIFAIDVNGIAEDGMELERNEMWTSATLEGLPDKATVMATAERLVRELELLVKAPIVEPFIGPAILRNRASGVFFHEIFGHRIESHRQKSESSGKTFTKKVGELILPDFISIYDDPTLKTYNGIDLRGYYRFDDEGSVAERVDVVENGILRNFLNTRSPIENFPKTNGHARRDYGREIVSRQGNLIIESSKVTTPDKLRELLIAECKKQNKPYGLMFEDISGGLTMTQRGGPQAFKVVPLLVSRVYADGTPDEYVRGVEIVGTPLTSFSKIIITGDDTIPFNGTCGAESGYVPVSAVSPSILVSEIEVQKREKGQEKPPILLPPAHDKSEGK